MYRDPTKIRSHVVTVRFNDLENELLEAITNYTGEQKSVLIRKRILNALKGELTNHKSVNHN